MLCRPTLYRKSFKCFSVCCLFCLSNINLPESYTESQKPSGNFGNVKRRPLVSTHYTMRTKQLKKLEKTFGGTELEDGVK